MKLGLIGLPGSGKTTLFKALTGSDTPLGFGTSGRLDVQVEVVDVPDLRLEALARLFNPRKVVPAKMTYADIGGLAKGISEGGLSGPFRNELAQMDGFLHVVRGFENPAVPHPEGSIDPQRDFETLEGEFQLVDLITLENRISRLKDEIAKKKENREVNQRELEMLQGLLAGLEGGTPLRQAGLSAEEIGRLRGYGLLSLKPQLVLLNLGEEATPATYQVTGAPGVAVVPVYAQIEMEIAQLEPEEAEVFMAEYNISEPARGRIIRESYGMLSIQTFFTVGEDEVRAWPHSIGATAPEAAGRIHSDLQRGFISAEIIHCDTLLELGGLTEAKAVGKLRIEGKMYVVQDGDTMNVRFNV